jgi:hypothetical protein
VTSSRTSRNGGRVVVAVVWACAVAMAVGLVAITLDTVVEAGAENVDPATLSFLALAPVMVAYATLGALILLRRPGHRVGWLLLATAPTVLAVFLGFTIGALLSAARGLQDPVAGIASLVGTTLLGPATVMAFALLPILFPDGRLPGPRWRGPFALLLVGTVAGSLCFVVLPGQADSALAANPLGISGVSPALAVVGSVITSASIAFGAAMGLVSIAIRFRRRRGVERLQLKWMVAAVAVVFVVALPDQIGLAPDGIFAIPSAAVLGLIPIAVTIAILRYGLFEIDRIVSRSISYSLLVGLLGGAFVTVTLGLQTILAGVTQGESVPVALSTLAVLALFQPLRRRLRDLVDRRFNRARYDAARIVDGFGDRLRDEVDVRRVCDAMLATVAETVAPERSAIWLRRPAD